MTALNGLLADDGRQGAALRTEEAMRSTMRAWGQAALIKGAGTRRPGWEGST